MPKPAKDKTPTNAAGKAKVAEIAVTATKGKINTSKFYLQWAGHPIEDLTKFLAITRKERPNAPIVYLAGDSSLDNKYWVHSEGASLPDTVPDIYNHTLNRPEPKPDVAFWMNHILGTRATCINTSIEESMLRDRDKTLLPSDMFIRDNITAQDTLVVSVGANDVAMKPLPATIWHMLNLAWFTRRAALEDKSARSLQYFAHMFGPRIQSYIAQLTAKTKPRAVVLCMIYFPLQAGLGQRGWADWQLRALGYHAYPAQLQAAIRAMYSLATELVVLDGTKVLPCRLFDVLDGKCAKDYVDRVEPSENGGRKMAECFVGLMEEEGVLGKAVEGRRHDEAG